MKIDNKVEPLVREALDAAVKQDIDRFDAALDAFADDTKRRDGLALLFAISRLVLYDLNEGKNPTSEQVSDLADEIAESESWAGLPAEEIRNFLLWLLGDDSKTVSQDMYIVLVFVVTRHPPQRPRDARWAVVVRLPRPGRGHAGGRAQSVIGALLGRWRESLAWGI